MATINSYPNNADVYIGAQEVMKWHHGRTSGVYGAAGNLAVTAVTGQMKVSVAAGLGWMTDAGGDGIAFWNAAAIQLTLSAAPTSVEQARIDRIIVEWATTDYAALPEIKVLKGDVATEESAAPKALTNSSELRQISLAKVKLTSETTSITAANITDERLDATVCGIVSETVSCDTTVAQAQFTHLLNAIQQRLAELEASSAVELKKLLYTNVVVSANTWQSDTTYADYPFRAAVGCLNMTAADLPEVVFGINDAGIMCPVCESFLGGVYIYASEQPAAAITIPTIIGWRS